MTYDATSRYDEYVEINRHSMQHRPRINSAIATDNCSAAIHQGKALLKSLNDLNPKLDGWKIKDVTAKLAGLEDTYNKFMAFSTDHDAPFIQMLGNPR